MKMALVAAIYRDSLYVKSTNLGKYDHTSCKNTLAGYNKSQIFTRVKIEYFSILRVTLLAGRLFEIPVFIQNRESQNLSTILDFQFH
jgi:hypothetical protein